MNLHVFSRITTLGRWRPLRSRHQESQRNVASGDAARERRDWAAASRFYAQAVELGPTRADIWVQLGHARKESGDFAGAERAYLQALSIAPGVSDTHLNLGHLYKLQGDAEQAIAQYATAVRLNRHEADAWREICDLLDRGAAAPKDLLSLGHLDEPRTDEVRIAFDVTDLIAHWRQRRTPTGMQRVQIELLRAALGSSLAEGLAPVLFRPSEGRWRALAPQLILELADRSEADDAEWRADVARMETAVRAGAPLDEVRPEWLINLGGTWAQQGYGSAIERAKAAWGMRFGQYIHDLIPLVLPGRHADSVTGQFRGWIEDVVRRADLVIVNSEHTARDLAGLAETLDLDFSGGSPLVLPPEGGLSENRRKVDKTFLERVGLEPEGFILFVSTIEPRKNHLVAFGAMQEIIDQLGAERAPRLVCVGDRGWMSEPVFSAIEDDPRLQRSILLLHDVSDAELNALYAGCAFTIYPSQYEGWGLPVTEALSFHKAVIASKAASLPEAGAEFAVYVPPGDRAALAREIKRLWLNPAERHSIEKRIEAAFRPKTWRSLAETLLAATGRVQTPDASFQLIQLPKSGDGRQVRLRARLDADARVLGRLVLESGWSAGRRLSPGVTATLILPRPMALAAETCVWLEFACAPAGLRVEAAGKVLAAQSTGQRVQLDLAPVESALPFGMAVLHLTVAGQGAELVSAEITLSVGGTAVSGRGRPNPPLPGPVKDLVGF
jgi:glycosyltransferase involved in cell wall biosynthesis